MAHINYGTAVKVVDYSPISLADCKIHLLIDSTITNDDDFIEQLRLGVINFIEEDCDNMLIERKITLEKQDIDGYFVNEICLKYFPVGTVDALYDDETDLVDPADYIVKKQSGIIKLKDDECFTYGDESVQCTYYCGFRESEFPDILKVGLLGLVKILYDESLTTKETFTEQTGRYLLTKKMSLKALPPMLERIFNLYSDKGF